MNDPSSVTTVSVEDMLSGVGEAGVREVLQSFKCPLNKEIEDFVRRRAIDFTRRGIASVFLVGRRPAAPEEIFRLDGFFALASDVLVLDNVSRLSGTVRRRLARFGTRDERRDTLTLSAPLIAQLGRNYAHESRVSGQELVKTACRMVVEAQRILGGRMVYVETEDNARLIQFYSGNGFSEIGRRRRPDGSELVQMIRNLGPLHRARREPAT